MSKPRRFHARRGQKLSADEKLVGRNSRWGNPFPVRGMVDPRKPPRLVAHYAEKWGATVESLLCDTDKRAVTRFRKALRAGDLDYTVADVRSVLGGFDLGCPCGLEHCHADVLVELANGK